MHKRTGSLRHIAQLTDRVFVTIGGFDQERSWSVWCIPKRGEVKSTERLEPVQNGSGQCMSCSRLQTSENMSASGQSPSDRSDSLARLSTARVGAISQKSK
jgi:hypothetical protein